MKRVEALKIVKRNYPYGYSCTNVELIDNIYDYFELRNCSNCKYENKITMSGGARTCLLLDIGIGKDFGCNKYKEKL